MIETSIIHPPRRNWAGPHCVIKTLQTCFASDFIFFMSKYKIFGQQILWCWNPQIKKTKKVINKTIQSEKRAWRSRQSRRKTGRSGVNSMFWWNNDCRLLDRSGNYLFSVHVCLANSRRMQTYQTYSQEATLIVFVSRMQYRNMLSFNSTGGLCFRVYI